MGYAITAVCTVAAYTYTLDTYDVYNPFNPAGSLFPALVEGGNCSLTLNSFIGDATALVDTLIHNYTTLDSLPFGPWYCTLNPLSLSPTCSTGYQLVNGFPLYQQVQTYLQLNATMLLEALPLYILPPVPSQPAIPYATDDNTSIVFTTSQYSLEYGAPLIGCQIAAVPTLGFPPNSSIFPNGLPLTLPWIPSQVPIPFYPYTVYNPDQDQHIVVSLAAFGNLSVNTAYDFWSVCYNIHGASLLGILFDFLTPIVLPTLPTLPGASSTGGAAIGSSAVVSVSSGAASSAASASAASSAPAVDPGTSSSGGSSPAGPSVQGDPQFVGLRGQSYQVHGLDGGVYSLISDSLIQLSGRFTFLGDSASHPCLRDPVTGRPLYVCWSHPGSYISAIALSTNGGSRLVVEAGNGTQGFASVLVDEQASIPLLVGEQATLALLNQTVTVRRTDLRTLDIQHAGVYSMTITNSAGFVNIASLAVDNWPALVDSVQSHGLLGQTWRSHSKGQEVKCLEGVVDDYLLSDLYSCDDLYNRATC